MARNNCQDRTINQIGLLIKYFQLEKGCLTSATRQHFYSGAVDSFCLLLALLKTGGNLLCSRMKAFISQEYRGQGCF